MSEQATIYIIIVFCLIIFVDLIILFLLFLHKMAILAYAKKIEELESRLELNKAMNLYAYQSLMREIDFHLHNQTDELATSYFANCLELRIARGTSYSDYFNIWKSK